MFDTLGLLFGAILSFFRTCQSLLLETLALRLQLTVLKLHPTSKIFITELASELKIRVPDTFQLGAILPFFAFLASRKINKFRTPDMVCRKPVRFCLRTERAQPNIGCEDACQETGCLSC